MINDVIVFCPCCASAIDAVPHEEAQYLECESCGQHWSMVVDAERIREYSLV